MDKSSFQGQPPTQNHERATKSNPPANGSVCNEPPKVNQTNQPTNECQSPDSQRSVHSRRSKTSTISTRSINRRKRLELQRLEEKRQLAKQRDAEFLRQKYQLLQDSLMEKLTTVAR